jgi:hypothetical protein
MLKSEFVVYLVIILVAFILGVLRFKSQRVLKPIVILMGLTFVSECISRVLAFRIRNSNPPYHFLTPLQFYLWGVFFFHSIKSPAIKRFAYRACIAAALVSFLASVIFLGVMSYPTYNMLMQNFLFTALGFMLFMDKLDESVHKNIFLNPEFILSVSLVWFNLISFVFIAFHDLMLQRLMLGPYMRLINYVSNYVFYLLILYGISLTYFNKSKRNG